MTALMYAAKSQNSLEIIRMLINIETQMQTQEGYTALMFAAINNNVKGVKILQAYEKNQYLITDTTDFPRKTTALLMAASMCNVDCVNILFKSEHQESNFSLFHLSHINCDLDTIINNDNFIYDSKKVDILGRTPIFYLCMLKFNQQQYEILKYYTIKYQNNLEFWSKCDIYGLTVFHYLVMQDNIDCIRLLNQQVDNIVIISIKTLYNDSIHVDLSFQKLKLKSSITQRPNIFSFGVKLSLAHIGCCYNSQKFIKQYGNKFISITTDLGITNKTLSILYSKENIIQVFKNEQDNQINIDILQQCKKSQIFVRKSNYIQQQFDNSQIQQENTKIKKRTAKILSSEIEPYQTFVVNKSRFLQYNQPQQQNFQQTMNSQLRPSLLLQSLNRTKQEQISMLTNSEDDYQIINSQDEQIQVSPKQEQTQQKYQDQESQSQQDNQEDGIDYNYLQSIVQKSKIKPEQKQQKHVIFNDNVNNITVVKQKQNLSQVVEKLKQSINKHNDEGEQEENQLYDQINNKLNEVKQQITMKLPLEQQQKQNYQQQKSSLMNQIQLLKKEFKEQTDFRKDLKLTKLNENQNANSSI